MTLHINCKEVLSPELDEAQKVLVVDGLLTDESNVISVKLTNTVPFRDQAYLPEQAATVNVIDETGRKYNLKETSPGIYQLKDFNYKYGSTYTLHIITRDQKYYKSSPQTLLPKSEINTVSENIKTEALYTTLDGKIVSNSYKGLEFSTILYDSLGFKQFFRFSNTVLVEYTELMTVLAERRLFYYRWRKQPINQFFNLNETGLNKPNPFLHTLGFCPVDTSYLGVFYEYMNTLYKDDIITFHYFRDLYLLILTVKKYHLNQDIYEYYKDVNEQLKSENRIFDPVSFQVHGNITCQNNPEEPVIGIFEVSSTSLVSYSFNEFQEDGTIEFKPMKAFDIDKIVDNGKSFDYPDFWIFN